MWNQTVKRAVLVGLLVLCVVAASAGYSTLTWKPRYLEVRISYPPQPAGNVSFRKALETITSSSRALEDILANTSAELGVGLGEAVSLIQEAQGETDQMWATLEQEIVSHYVNIRNMIFRLDAGWVDPSKFRDWWFEDPSDSVVYAEFAREANISSVEILDDGSVDIQLETNRTVARATYASRWVTASGEYLLNGTDILVRDGLQWKFRKLGVHPFGDEGGQATGG